MGRAARKPAYSIRRLLIYLAEKTGKFLGTSRDRPELLSWLLFIASGLGPFSGQAVHFQHVAPEGLGYAVNRYRREAERHYQVLNDHLSDRTFIVGDATTAGNAQACVLDHVFGIGFVAGEPARERIRVGKMRQNYAGEVYLVVVSVQPCSPGCVGAMMSNFLPLEWPSLSQNGDNTRPASAESSRNHFVLTSRQRSDGSQF
jgi:hypothetical protein